MVQRSLRRPVRTAMIYRVSFYDGTPERWTCRVWVTASSEKEAVTLARRAIVPDDYPAVEVSHRGQPPSVVLEKPMIVRRASVPD